jgi:hypothetical protein
MCRARFATCEDMLVCTGENMMQASCPLTELESTSPLAELRKCVYEDVKMKCVLAQLMRHCTGLAQLMRDTAR